jgi:hypothetical protein
MRLTRGQKVQAIEGIDYNPYTVIMVGERGTVTYYEYGGGDVQLLEVCWDVYHKGLADWDNCTLLTPVELAQLRIEGPLSTIGACERLSQAEQRSTVHVVSDSCGGWG